MAGVYTRGVRDYDYDYFIIISKMRERCSGQVTKTYLAALGKHRFAQVYSQRFRVAQNVSHLRVRRWYFSTPDKDSNGIN